MKSDDLLKIARSVADQAVGGEEIDVMVGRGRSTTVRAYDGDVESFTSAGSDAIGIRVISDHRQGFASAGSLDPEVISETLAEARDNVAFGEVDEFNGLATPDGVEAVFHDHWNEDLLALGAEEKIEIALDIERRVRSGHPEITGVRTAAWSDSAGEAAYAASNGIAVSEVGASCSVGVQALAERDGETQIGGGGDAARSLDALDQDKVVADAIERSTRLLGATQPPSARMPILLEPRLALTLLGIVSGMVDGESVTKGRTPFADRLGEMVASPLLTLTDDPTNPDSIAATSWDGEGLACRRNVLIGEGRLETFLQNSYTGRRMATASTGSALRSTRSLPGVGAQVLIIEPGTRSLEAIMAEIGTGLFVNSFAGLHSGVNSVSGDFSVGADGIMIRDGALAEPVREITVASTIQKMLGNIGEVGGDAEWSSSGDQGASILINDVSVSGS